MSDETAPEIAAKQALHDLAGQVFADDADVAVHYGVPPERTPTPFNVWVGGHSAEEAFRGMRGAQGPTITNDLTVEMFCDAYDQTAGATPQGASEAALQLAHRLRTALREAIRDNTPVEADRPRPRVRWQLVSGHRSIGALPAEGGGFVDQVQLDVLFTIRH